MARILITDDEEGMRVMISATLTAAGHTVIETKTAREALQQHADTPADLVITDLVMKEMDGTELVRRLRASSPRTPVIAISGNHHSTIYLNMARLLGAKHVLAKPFSPQELTAAVAEVLADGNGTKAAPAQPPQPPAAG